MTAMTPTKITIYGSSDDCIEVEGKAEGCDEYNGEVGYLACSDGSIIRIAYSEKDDGCWRVIREHEGDGTFVIEFSPKDGEDDDGYSDRATLDGVEWVTFCGDDAEVAKKFAELQPDQLRHGRELLEKLDQYEGFDKFMRNLGAELRAALLVDISEGMLP